MKRRWTWGLLLVVGLWGTTAYGSLSECIDATCRVTVPGSAGKAVKGTGCVFEISEGRVYVLTAAHVVGSATTVQCEFWRSGYRSSPLVARVIRRLDNNRCDAAVVALSVSQFAGILPKVIPVAPRNYIVRPGATLTSVGCAKGAWSTGWKGHALGYRGADLHFRPVPADGRSGSAIFDAKGEYIVGLLRARTTNNSEGIACSLQALYRGLSASSSGTTVQCGPDGCPTQRSPGVTPRTPYGGVFRPFGGRAMPWKQQQPQQQGPWPTLPQPEATPSVDLSETNNRLDGIQVTLDKLIVMLETPQTPTPAEPLVPIPDPAFVDDPQIEVNRTAIGVLEKASEKNAEGIVAVAESVKTWAAEHGSLRERFTARMDKVRAELGEEASKRDVLKAYLKDLIAEKLQFFGFLFGVPGAGIAIWLIRRDFRDKRETGDPLMIEKVFSELGELRGRLSERRSRRRDDPDDDEELPSAPASRRKAK